MATRDAHATHSLLYRYLMPCLCVGSDGHNSLSVSWVFNYILRGCGHKGQLKSFHNERIHQWRVYAKFGSLDNQHTSPISQTVLRE